MRRNYDRKISQWKVFLINIAVLFLTAVAYGQSIGTLSANFEGIGYDGYNPPPDPVLAVGPNNVVEVVNAEFVAFTKDGTRTIVYQSALSDFFNDHSDKIYDCKIEFDKYSQRWVLLSLADNGSTGYYLLAVSKGTDPNPSSWYTYKLDASVDSNSASGLRADYPGLGYDANCVYITSNQYVFGVDGPFQYAKIRILSKSQIYSGQTPTAPFTDFVGMKDADGTTSFTIKPVQQFGSSSAYYLVDTKKNGGSAITLWKITNPLSNPSLAIQGTISVKTYSVPPDAEDDDPLGSISVKLVGTSTQDAMYRDGYVYTSFTTGHNWGSSTVSAIQYEKIDVSSNTAVIDDIYGSDGVYYYYPNVYADAYGDIGLVFCRSNLTEYPGVWWTYRLPSDGAARAPQSLHSGEGYYDYGDQTQVNRYGDYSGMCLDASNDNQIWFCGEWARSNHTQWDTQIGSFAFPLVEFTNNVGGTIAGGTLRINSNQTINSGSALRLGMGSSNDELTLAQGSGNQDRFVNTNNVPLAKHNNWDQTASTYLLNNTFTVNGTAGETETSYFTALNPATITASSVDGANLSGMQLQLNDPWYLNSNGSQGNNFAQAAIPVTQTSTPMTGAYNQGTGGVFLFQGDAPKWDETHYSVGFPTGQTISVGGTNHQLYLLNWSASGATIQNSTASQTGVEFTSGSATVTANVKGHLLTDTQVATGPDNQRKMVTDSHGTLDMVYTSGGKVWLTTSTDGGSTWSNEQQISGSGTASSPSIAASSLGDAYIIWQEITGSTKTLYIRSLYGSIPSAGQLATDVSSFDLEPSVAVSDNGAVLVVYRKSDGLGNPYELYCTYSGNGQSFPAGQTLFAGTPVPDDYPSVAWNPATSQFMLSSSNTSSGLSVELLTFDGTTWQRYSAYTSPSVPSTTPYSQVAVDGSGRAYVTWIGYDDYYGENSASMERSYSGGSFSAVNIFRDEILYYPPITLTSVSGHSDASGGVSVLYTSDPSSQDALFDVYSTDGTTFNGSVLIQPSAPVSYPNLAESAPAQQVVYCTAKGSSAPYSLVSQTRDNSTPGSSSGTLKIAASGEQAHSIDPATWKVYRRLELTDTTTGGQLIIQFGNILSGSTRMNRFSKVDTLPSNGISPSFMRTGAFNFSRGTPLTVECGARDINWTEKTTVTVQLVDSMSGRVISQIRRFTFPSSDTTTYTNELMNLTPSVGSIADAYVSVNVEGVDTGKVIVIPANVYVLNAGSSNTPPQTQSVYNALPAEYRLDQNYPNPFNPTTMIDYQLPIDSHVVLKVYDVLGREVRTLADDNESAGYHSVVFDASNLPSGVYLYKFAATPAEPTTAASYTSVRKLVLVK
ncbi:MAG: T9SS type A sorting domain-containing protein [Bacteroidetes bacterium]|nr:T9SS type A sorting domain-containing protein [Bacteroidota bacterium]